MSANVESMFYYGEVPWHGLGTELDHPATAEEAIQAAGMDWDVRIEETITQSGLHCPTARAVIRNDSNVIVGDRLGSRYTPVQNREAFRFFDTVVGDGQAIYHTAGVLGRGEKVWILAQIPGAIKVRGTDEISKFLLLMNSHDGSTPLRMFYTPIRVVCQNTLNAAIGGFNSVTDQGIDLKHHKAILSKAQAAAQALSLTNQYYERFGEAAQAMATRMLTDSDVDKYLAVLIPGDGVRAANSRDRVKHLAASEKNRISGIEGTVWSTYNAFVEYIDYIKAGRRSNPSSRLNSVWLGSGAESKARAWQEAVALIGS